MRKFCLYLIGIAVLVLGPVNACLAATTQVDALIEKLVEKGILTKQESIALKAEIVQDEQSRQEEIRKTTMPDWVRNMKIKGDFRLRYQGQQTKGTAADQHRPRIRLRLGAETKVNEKIKVGLGLATGGTSDPRSTNQTLTDSFSKKPIALDYAFVEYAAVSWLTLIGGKFINPIWEPADLFWDTDITPEGGAMKLAGKINPHLRYFVNTGIFMLDESGGNIKDPMMAVVQPGLEWDPNEKVGLKVALAYYDFSNVQKSALDASAGTNTLAGGRLLYDYDALMPAFELSFSDPWAKIEVPQLALFGEYVNNFDPKTNHQGFLLGFKIGHKKCAHWGQWQFKYMYRKLEKDAVPDIFPDSDFYGGGTHVRGHETIFEYGLGKNVSLAFDYYYAEIIAGSKSERRPQHLWQVDFNFKF